MAFTHSTDHYDLISLGSGEASKYIAWTIAGTQGKRCATIERQWYGGSCPNVACLPSKNVIHSAKVRHLASHASNDNTQQGLGERGADMQAVKRRKDDMIESLMAMHRGNFEKNGVDMIWGTGKFVGPKTIEVTNPEGQKRTVSANVVMVCTGSRAVISDIPGLKQAAPLTHVELLDLEQVPDHLIILGGGYIGLEFSQAMRRLGSTVTVLEHNERILKREDEDMANKLQEVLVAEGVQISTSTSISEVSGTSGDSVALKGTKAGQPFEITGSHILCATGRRPNNDNIGLEAAGVKLDSKGFVVVDE